MRTLCLASLVCLVGTLLLGGCSNNAPQAERESSNLKPLAVYYGRYVGQHRGKSPADEKELKEFIRKQPTTELEAFGIKDVDALFISSRDKKPYKFSFQQKSVMPGSIAVFAWEQDGVDGKRYVGGTLGQIEEVDEAKFRELVPNP
ncbi:MAG: hypothetical protein U0892_08275 [Pirellulales bacterium]